MEYLIPQDWFLGLSQPWLLGIVAVGLFVLAKGADLLVDGASGIAYRIGISKVIVGATIVSLGTTSPECAVSVVAAWSGEPGLAMGNAVGSIIADSGLIFGIGCLLTVLPADRFVLSRQGWVQFGSGVLLAVVCYGSYVALGDQAVIQRWVGVAFLVLLLVYLVVSVRWSRQHRSGEPFQGHEEPEPEPEAKARARGGSPVPRLVILMVVGLVFVIGSSRVVICSVTELAENHWYIPKVVIAATLVALGTSLPELVIGITSIFKGHKEILVGNIIGADILNVLFVTGAAAVAAPLPLVEHGAAVPKVLLYVHLPAMLLILLLFRLFIVSASRRGTFRRWYGIPLLALYVAYCVIQFVVST